MRDTRNLYINTGRIDPDGYVWTIGKSGFAEPYKAQRLLDELRDALLSFATVRDQMPQSHRLIDKKLDDLSPITVTVTKGQFRSALEALRKTGART